ncbi:conserved hypothetical protein [Vibrio nigripulchritudo MADA3029]|uniref:Uncharacterized protein n=1 Tax=Vibrio nigripulchritudo SOn1 TaxID=1238450 RepID=A0AAV2VUR2_9VIBR|nr:MULTISPECIES: hypothetical protein [Vibrio]UAB73634.1 hypothetical protein INR79_20995 [Vibrio sp. SCSIO 43132]CCN46601.1 conserved hypothetical protein [Vibrio nigripulchritudo MADA3020]CCN54622.1 conserved hypothetical protein [Vibrio nigripulchritudo MADA3021]CCN59460.1 conserved hypothetical protein [Vibrio nigripulchritudo MADA3029]CCO48139.1 conserved hypothetical protein [Vibrio nigripulchritudo SOn1]
MSDAKAGACLYILTGLLQRLEKENSGLIKDMIEGVKADQLSISNSLPDLPEREKIDDVFKETLVTLERADQLMANSKDS